jgi:hypothetical protein
MEHENQKDLTWYTERVGQRIYRKNNICECIKCVDVFENGLIITDTAHAHYLFDCQNEMGLIYLDATQRDLLVELARKITENQKSIPPDFNQIITENFNDLI